MCCCVMAVLITAHFSSCFVIVSFMVCDANIVQGVCTWSVCHSSISFSVQKEDEILLSFHVIYEFVSVF